MPRAASSLRTSHRIQAASESMVSSAILVAPACSHGSQPISKRIDFVRSAGFRLSSGFTGFGIPGSVPDKTRVAGHAVVLPAGRRPWNVREMKGIPSVRESLDFLGNYPYTTRIVETRDDDEKDETGNRNRAGLVSRIGVTRVSSPALVSATPAGAGPVPSEETSMAKTKIDRRERELAEAVARAEQAIETARRALDVMRRRGWASDIHGLSHGIELSHGMAAAREARS